MKKLLITIVAITSLSCLASVSIDTPERLITIVDESGRPVKGAIVEVQASYSKCMRIYWSVGNPCQFKSLFYKSIVTDENGEAIIPAIKEYIPNGINTKNRDISFSINVDNYTSKELSSKYSTCGYQLSQYLKSKPLSTNLKDFLENRGYASSCFYDLRDEDSINDEMTGKIECMLFGTRDLGFVNGKRTHIDISLVEGINDYKKACDE